MVDGQGYRPRDDVGARHSARDRPLQDATASAKEADEKDSASKGESSQVLAAPSDAASGAAPSLHRPGEGIGLSIVKRLCELLDASIEIASSAETGTTSRVVFPRAIGPRPPSRTAGGVSVS